MGPRSENRGYAKRLCGPSGPVKGLQWVHGPENRGYAKVRTPRIEPRQAGFNGSTVRRTVVMPRRPRASGSAFAMLQWVHGPRTVVMYLAAHKWVFTGCSFNGSTVR